MKNPNDLSKEQLAAIVTGIRDILARPEWDSESVEEVAQVLCAAGLLVETPDGRVSTPDEVVVRRLAEHAESKGLLEDAFDEDVYAAAGAASLPRLNAEETGDEQKQVIAHFEDGAADVNNGGFAAQLRFLLGGYESLEAGERELRRLIDEWAGQ
jgi:hypothetical protein